MSDLIKREDAIKAINARSNWYQVTCNGKQIAVMLMAKDVNEILEKVPSADRPQGEWVPFEYGDERWHKCTACGVADRYIEYVERPNGTTGKLVAIRNYCPNCGARMFAKDTNVPNKEGADDEV